MFVLGTAGHIDHGKSLLVKALTGIDPDRLREEKERGMTIDLGFAWLRLPSGREVGIVDVPGHERFIKNMLAGVGGIDLALLVVAANESVMPQTREHLAILDLLDVRRGVAVITKKDLVDEEFVSLVRMEVEEILAATGLAGAPIVAVSAVTGEGLAELTAAIDRLLDSAEPKKDTGRPRLPVDRIFTIGGAGTIVTGTLIDGSLTVGQEVEIVPSGIKSRLRGLQTHKTRVDTAAPGSRVAANLVGVALSRLQRGDVVTTPGWLKGTTMLTAKLRLLGHLRRPLRHNLPVTFHTGAAEAEAKVRLLESDELRPGQSGWVQVALEHPLAVVRGDHFIIRSTVETLGGGRIIEAHSKRLRRFRPAIIEGLKAREEGTPEEAVMALLGEAMEMGQLLSRSGLPPDRLHAAVESLVGRGDLARLGQGDQALLMTGPGWERLAGSAATALQEYHQKFPARSGMPRGELVSRLKLDRHAGEVMQRLSAEGVLVEEAATVRIPSHRVQLTADQQQRLDAFLRSLEENRYAPPGDLIPEPDLLNPLIEQRRVVKVSEGVVFSAAAYDEMEARVVSHLKEQGTVSLAQVRDMFQTSRKYAQAFLEHLDARRVTRRVGDERVLC